MEGRAGMAAIARQEEADGDLEVCFLKYGFFSCRNKSSKCSWVGRLSFGPFRGPDAEAIRL